MATAASPTCTEPLQVAFGWSDEHLHRFVIHGRLYGEGGLVDPRRVRLADVGLRLRERLLYEYDCIDGSTTFGSSRSCRSTHDGATRSAAAADVRHHQRTAADRGRPWSSGSATRAWVSPAACSSCSRRW